MTRPGGGAERSWGPPTSPVATTADRSRRAAEHLGPARTRLADGLDARLGPDRAAALLARLDAVHGDLFAVVDAVYGGTADTREVVDRLLDVAVGAAVARPARWAALDAAREADPEHWERSRHVGYVCYADRFAGSLRGVLDHVDHLRDLGVTYLHLMPLLRPRPGDSDGGYAVADFRAVDPRLGDVADLEAVCEALDDEGVAVCLDLVLNHTAAEHEWAVRARAGEQRYQRYYRLLDDPDEVARWDAELPEVFPTTAPGSFTWQPELQRWAWTTFNDFQWDLDWSDPDVCVEMVDVALWLANRGAQVLRLDALPFLGKRAGTDSQNQPEAHLLAQLLRAVVRLAAPATLLLAEAIVPPGALVPYLGAHERRRDECHLAYHNQLMVQLWAAAAARDVRVMRSSLRRMPPVPDGAGWVTYLRCHDDVGWAVDDADAAATGASGAGHRRFLADFYAGRVEGSFAEGLLFQDDPLTGDARTSGTAAQLAGVTQGLRLADPALVDAGVRRVLALHSVVAAHGGVPLIWMGDEVAADGDRSWREDPDRSADNRWEHRPVQDWDAVAAARADPTSAAGRVWHGLRDLLAARRRLDALRSGGRAEVLDVGPDAVLALARRHPRSAPLLALLNVADGPVRLDAEVLARAGMRGPARAAAGSDPFVLERRDDGGFDLLLAGLAWLWLVPDDGTVGGAVD